MEQSSHYRQRSREKAIFMIQKHAQRKIDNKYDQANERHNKNSPPGTDQIDPKHAIVMQEELARSWRHTCT